METYEYSHWEVRYRKFIAENPEDFAKHCDGPYKATIYYTRVKDEDRVLKHYEVSRHFATNNEAIVWANEKSTNYPTIEINEGEPLWV